MQTRAVLRMETWIKVCVIETVCQCVGELVCRCVGVMVLVCRSVAVP